MYRNNIYADQNYQRKSTLNHVLISRFFSKGYFSSNLTLYLESLNIYYTQCPKIEQKEEIILQRQNSQL